MRRCREKVSCAVSFGAGIILSCILPSKLVLMISAVTIIVVCYSCRR
ncbi:MAG: hypothetical protein Q4A12_05240 [Eubacteriales bacterium]|nr:hypothetical protein [Eubacteriales bacterium]